MRRKLGALALIAAAGIAGEARAAFEDGNTLFVHCRSRFGQSGCEGYIAGIADALAGNAIDTIRACIPSDITKRKAYSVVVQWLERHPEERHKPAPGLVARALSEAYPCR